MLAWCECHSANLSTGAVGSPGERRHKGLTNATTKKSRCRSKDKAMS